MKSRGKQIKFVKLSSTVFRKPQTKKIEQAARWRRGPVGQMDLKKFESILGWAAQFFFVASGIRTLLHLVAGQRFEPLDQRGLL